MASLPGSGGFVPKLTKESLGVAETGGSFLASEHMMVRRVGITVDSTSVAADADGNKVIPAGTVLGQITATGKFGIYNNTYTDGRETAVGFLLESINLRHGDVITGLLQHGSVVEARVSGLDAAARTDLAGRIVFQ